MAVSAAPATTKPADRLERWLFLASTALGVLALCWWAWPRLGALRDEHRRRWLASEAKAYADLHAACRQGEPRSVYRAFDVWRRRLPHPAIAAALAEEIESVLFAGAAWSRDEARAFARRAEAVRPGRSPGPHAAPDLPPLNPARIAGRL